MDFRISFLHDRKRYSFNVNKLPSDDSFDYYQVIGGNGSITLKNNAPVMRRHSLKHRAPQWKVHSNDIWNATFKEMIIRELNKHIGSSK